MMFGDDKPAPEIPVSMNTPAIAGTESSTRAGIKIPRQRRRSIIIWTTATILLAAACLIYADVERDSKPIYTRTEEVPQMPVAIVFGAGVGTPVLKDRVHTAINLYKAGKVQKLLMTGDNGHIEYDEPQAMKQLAVAAGVPAVDVVCDYAGFRTYDSLYRARDIFGVRDAILVTQRFHLPRAIFLARRLGLTVVGMDAALRDYGEAQSWFALRELAAVETAWLDVFVHRKPKFLGKKEPLFTQVGEEDSSQGG